MGVLADLIALVNGNTEKTLDVLIQERATETNSKIDNRASQESIVSLDVKVQTGNNLIGATNNTGGTATSGSIFAKLNKLLTDWTTTRAGYLDNINTNVGSLVNGRVVKSVQRGVTKILSTVPSGDPVLTTINYVNISKTAIFITSAEATSTSTLILLNGTQLEIRRNGSYEARIYWQVIEFY